MKFTFTEGLWAAAGFLGVMTLGLISYALYGYVPYVLDQKFETTAGSDRELTVISISDRDVLGCPTRLDLDEFITNGISDRGIRCSLVDKGKITKKPSLVEVVHVEFTPEDIVREIAIMEIHVEDKILCAAWPPPLGAHFFDLALFSEFPVKRGFLSGVTYTLDDSHLRAYCKQGERPNQNTRRAKARREFLFVNNYSYIAT